jgi:hypothetical protein
MCLTGRFYSIPQGIILKTGSWAAEDLQITSFRYSLAAIVFPPVNPRSIAAVHKSTNWFVGISDLCHLAVCKWRSIQLPKAATRRIAYLLQ